MFSFCFVAPSPVLQLPPPPPSKILQDLLLFVVPSKSCLLCYILLSQHAVMPLLGCTYGRPRVLKTGLRVLEKSRSFIMTHGAEGCNVNISCVIIFQCACCVMCHICRFINFTRFEKDNVITKINLIFATRQNVRFHPGKFRWFSSVRIVKLKVDKSQNIYKIKPIRLILIISNGLWLFFHEGKTKRNWLKDIQNE